MKAIFGWIPVWLRPQIASIRWRIVAEILLLLALSCVPIGSAELSRYAVDRVIGEQSMENLYRLLKYAIVFLTVVVILKYSLSWLWTLSAYQGCADECCCSMIHRTFLKAQFEKTFFMAM